MSQSAIITALAQRIRDEFNTIKGLRGDLSALSTTDKSSLVAAINEIVPKLLFIDDGSTNAAKVWSSNKIQSQIDNAITILINGAGADDDSLKELADKIVALAQADTGLVSAKNSQSFTAGEQTQGRNNIGAASQAALTTLTTNVGDTTHDFTTDFETGLN